MKNEIHRPKGIDFRKYFYRKSEIENKERGICSRVGFREVISLMVIEFIRLYWMEEQSLDDPECPVSIPGPGIS